MSESPRSAISSCSDDVANSDHNLSDSPPSTVSTESPPTVTPQTVAPSQPHTPTSSHSNSNNDDHAHPRHQPDEANVPRIKSWPSSSTGPLRIVHSSARRIMDTSELYLLFPTKDATSKQTPWEQAPSLPIPHLTQGIPANQPDAQHSKHVFDRPPTATTEDQAIDRDDPKRKFDGGDWIHVFDENETMPCPWCREPLLVDPYFISKHIGPQGKQHVERTSNIKCPYEDCDEIPLILTKHIIYKHFDLVSLCPIVEPGSRCTGNPIRGDSSRVTNHLNCFHLAMAKPARDDPIQFLSIPRERITQGRKGREKRRKRSNSRSTTF
ncbi:hypothetical protein NLI96_g7950 [Meripilus lineatus]|uniref:Uncharacterized protein n=1 Tax=Meripilus lineatus TaxID=2056292 RepID=A0AAD5UYF5_9APHY|nr:hypothetical protein NLI96_g7950 [Physisporinus lineatus]